MVGELFCHAEEGTDTLEVLQNERIYLFSCV